MWILNDCAVTPIDPRTNRAGPPIRLPTERTSAIAVGAGKVWVAAEPDGTVWQIEPGPEPTTRAIAVGVGVEYIAFGAGAAWAGNYIDGTVARIDARTNAITRVPVGAVQALAAGPGGAWVEHRGPAPGGRPAGIRLRRAGLGYEPAGRPDRVRPPAPGTGRRRPARDGRRDPARARAARVQSREVHGRLPLVRRVDGADRRLRARRCAANAGAYAQAEDLVAVIGPWSSYCSEIEIPITNRAPGGPLAMISPTNTDPGLTRASSDNDEGEPEVHYPTGIRNFVRLAPGDDLQGAAHAVVAKRLGLAAGLPAA